MEYRGYTARIEFDESIQAFHGEVLNINDVITFQGTSVDQLRREFEASVDDYLAWCEEAGEEPDKPFSGKFLLRLDPDLHRRAALQAAKEGLSLTAWTSQSVERCLESVADHPGIVDAIREAVLTTSVTKHTSIDLSLGSTLQGSFVFSAKSREDRVGQKSIYRLITADLTPPHEGWFHEPAES